jgi:hypothetical protein
MLRYVVTIIMLLPVHAFAGTTESVLQYIMDDYKAQCVAAQQESMEAMREGEDLNPVKIKFYDEDIYEIDITAQGKKATVFHASPWCPQIGFPWCGTGGCTSYVIVDGVSFETWGGRPLSVSVSDYRVVVIVPRSGGSCVDANGSTLSNSASCYSVAVWDDQTKIFNSMPSVIPVFKVSDFMP